MFFCERSTQSTKNEILFIPTTLLATKTLIADVKLTPKYSSERGEIEIETVSKTLSIPIEDGTHTWTSPFFEAGRLRFAPDPVLEAAVHMTYDYDTKSDTLTLTGNDYVSLNGLSTCLVTRPRNTKQHAYHPTCMMPGVDPCGSNRNWNYMTGLTPTLGDEFTCTVRTINEQIIRAASKTFAVVRVRTPPPKMLTLATERDHNDWIDMYSKEGNYLGTYDPEKDYPAGTTQDFVIRSTWGGLVTFKLNENIANVIGSSNDPKIKSRSWILLWEEQYGGVSVGGCTSHGWASNGAFTCNDSNKANIVGGHVITGKTAKSVSKGGDTYIIPICKSHNGNDGVYMRANVYTGGVWLKNFNN